MVGPGTGIAPFRAFIEERRALGSTGKNWLFFGDRSSKTDYLYGEEWEKYRSDGLLTELDLAWSRDQAEKEYVQHKMLAKGGELFAWLQDGAYFYVCGDASRMAKDVDLALRQIAATEGRDARGGCSQVGQVPAKGETLPEGCILSRKGFFKSFGDGDYLYFLLVTLEILLRFVLFNWLQIGGRIRLPSFQ